MDSALFVFKLIVLVFSVVVHEISHGFVAQRLGDPTAQRAGRLTLNPIPHIDLFGSVILPLIMYFSNTGVLFGWAKPVPVDPRYFKHRDRDMAYVSAAGPLSNLTLAAVFAVFFRALPYFSTGATALALQNFFIIIVMTNIQLAIFNLVPIPPLDGSGVLLALLPRAANGIREMLERYGIFFLLAFLFLGMSIIAPVIEFLARLFLGV